MAVMADIGHIEPPAPKHAPIHPIAPIVDSQKNKKQPSDKKRQKKHPEGSPDAPTQHIDEYV